MHYILYNTLSGNKQGLEYSRLLLGNSVPADAQKYQTVDYDDLVG